MVARRRGGLAREALLGVSSFVRGSFGKYAYHRYVQIGCIVQGLLLHLAINYREIVWATFKGWLRTMKPELIPSEMVVCALRESFHDFLANSQSDDTQFITDRADPSRLEALLLTG